MSIDKFFARRYNSKTYNCAHFVAEVWQELTGQDLQELLHGFLCGPTTRQVSLSDLRAVRLLERPAHRCLVAATAPAHHEAHVGVWLSGKVLHLTNHSVQYQPLDVFSLGFTRIRFFHVV